MFGWDGDDDNAPEAESPNSVALTAKVATAIHDINLAFQFLQHFGSDVQRNIFLWVVNYLCFDLLLIL